MSSQFDELVRIMARLRAPDGCPWDREQSHERLKPYLIEECYEVIEAIDEGEPEKLRDELGDLLLQVVFHAQMANERGEYTADDVCAAISEKLVRRHPHVFGGAEGVDTPDDVVKQWDEIKREEKGCEDRTSALHGVPRAMPSMLRALKLQKKAARVGFDWESVDGAYEKVEEEFGEFREALASGNASDMEEELGDLFFSLVNVARFIEVNPEEALERTIRKFIRRFEGVERVVAAAGKKIKEATFDEMEAAYQEIKRAEKGRK